MSKLTVVLKISKTALYEKHAAKAYDHAYEYGPNCFRYDPQTGKELWTFRESKIPAYASGKIAGLTVVELKDAALVYSSTKLNLPDVNSYGFLPNGSLDAYAASRAAAVTELQAAAETLGPGVFVAENVRDAYVV